MDYELDAQQKAQQQEQEAKAKQQEGQAQEKAQQQIEGEKKAQETEAEKTKAQQIEAAKAQEQRQAEETKRQQEQQQQQEKDRAARAEQEKQQERAATQEHLDLVAAAQSQRHAEQQAQKQAEEQAQKLELEQAKPEQAQEFEIAGRSGTERMRGGLSMPMTVQAEESRDVYRPGYSDVQRQAVHAQTHSTPQYIMSREEAAAKMGLTKENSPLRDEVQHAQAKQQEPVAGHTHGNEAGPADDRHNTDQTHGDFDREEGSGKDFDGDGDHDINDHLAFNAAEQKEHQQQPAVGTSPQAQAVGVETQEPQPQGIATPATSEHEATPPGVEPVQTLEGQQPEPQGVAPQQAEGRAGQEPQPQGNASPEQSPAVATPEKDAYAEKMTGITGKEYRDPEPDEVVKGKVVGVKTLDGAPHTVIETCGQDGIKAAVMLPGKIEGATIGKCVQVDTGDPAIQAAIDAAKKFGQELKGAEGNTTVSPPPIRCGHLDDCGRGM